MLKSKVLNDLIQERFEYAVEAFNFYKVKIVMDALEWGWATTGGKVPRINEMQDNVWRLFENALGYKETGKSASSSSGGFEVEITAENIVHISFIAEEISSEGYE